MQFLYIKTSARKPSGRNDNGAVTRSIRWVFYSLYRINKQRQLNLTEETISLNVLDYLRFGQLDSAYPLLLLQGFDHDPLGFENMVPLTVSFLISKKLVSDKQTTQCIYQRLRGSPENINLKQFLSLLFLVHRYLSYYAFL